MDYHERKTKLEERKIVTYYYYLAILGAGIICLNGHIRVETARVGRPWSDMLYRILFVHV